MKSSWPSKPLEELCEFRNGLWKGKKPPYVHVGVIRNTNFTKSGFLDDSDIAYLDVEEKQFAKRQLQYGDLILEKSGGGPKQPVGRVISFEKTEGLYSFSNFTSVIRVADPNLLSFRFLHRLLYWYYVSGVTEGMQRRSTGIRNLDFSSYKQLPVPLPPLAEQKRIVSILDEAFAAIATATANAEKNLANARELLDRKLNTVFDEREGEWQLTTFGNLVTKSRGGISIKSREYGPEGVPVLTKGDVKPLGRVEHGGKYVDSAHVKAAGWPLTTPGDLIITTRDLKPSAPFLGLVAPIPTDRHYLVNQGATFFSVDNSQISSEYFVYWCCSDQFRSYIRVNKSGATQVHIRQSELFNAPIWFPTIARQDAIVAYLNSLLDQAERLGQNFEARVNLFAELKQSFLHKAFTGELTDDTESADRLFAKASV